jgi:hypothetical protein
MTIRSPTIAPSFDHSIKSLLEYFIANDVLDIPAKRTFKICDITAIVQEDPRLIDAKDLRTGLEKIEAVFQTLFIAIGKVVTVHWNGALIDWGLGKTVGLSFCCSRPIQLQTSRGRLDCARVSWLFKLMMANAIFSLRLAANQSFVVPVNKLDTSKKAPQTPEEWMQRCISSGVPKGYKARCKVFSDHSGGISKWNCVQSTASFNGISMQAIGVRAAHGLELNLFTEVVLTVADFQRWIKKKSELPFLPNQVLQIQGEALQELRDHFNHDPRCVLNLLVTPFGKTISLRSHKQTDPHVEWIENGIAIFFRDGGAVVTEPSLISTGLYSLRNLAEVFEMHSPPEIPFKPNQKLRLGMGILEAKMLSIALMTGSTRRAGDFIKAFLHYHRSAAGGELMWFFDCPASLRCALLSSSSGYTLEVSSSHLMKLRQVPIAEGKNTHAQIAGYSFGGSAPSSFPTVFAFQQHFREHESLIIPANQPFEIGGLSKLFDKYPQFMEHLIRSVTDLGKPTETFVVERFKCVLDAMLQPLAMNAVLIPLQGSAFVIELLKDGFRVTCSEEMRIQREKGDVRESNLAAFVDRMKACDIHQMTFAANQALVFTLTDEEATMELNRENVGLVLKKKIGSDCSIISPNSQLHFVRKKDDMQRHILGIYSTEGMEFSIPLVFSVFEFQRALEVDKGLTLGPGQLLVVQGSQIRDLCVDRIANFQDRLSQLLVSQGKIIDFTFPKSGKMTVNWSENAVEISISVGCQMVAKSHHIRTDIPTLVKILMNRCGRPLFLLPKQDLFLLLSELEHLRISKHVLLCREKGVTNLPVQVMLALRHYHGHIAFALQIDLGGKSTLSLEHPEGNRLWMSSTQGIIVSLRRDFILVFDIIKRSSKALLEGLLEGSVDACMLLLFRVLVERLCVDQVNPPTVETTFTKKNRDTIKLLTKDAVHMALMQERGDRISEQMEDFISSLEAVKGSSAQRELLFKILMMTPEKFMEFINGTYKQELVNMEDLRRVVDELIKMTHKEMQGSPLLVTSQDLSPLGMDEPMFVPSPVNIIVQDILKQGLLCQFIQREQGEEIPPIVIAARTASSLSSS